MCHNGAFAVWFLHSKKGGKIQTGLNCEVDSLSKVWLWLVYSSTMCTRCFETQSSLGCTCTRRSKFLTHSLYTWYKSLISSKVGSPGNFKIVTDWRLTLWIFHVVTFLLTGMASINSPLHQLVQCNSNYGILSKVVFQMKIYTQKQNINKNSPLNWVSDLSKLKYSIL